MNTGVGFHNYPFPCNGNGIEDPTGSTYGTASKDAVIAEYNEEQKAACEAWGVELLIDVFPQASEFDIPEFSAIWAYSKPVEFDEIGNKLDEVAWSALITCWVVWKNDLEKNKIFLLQNTFLCDNIHLLGCYLQHRQSS